MRLLLILSLCLSWITGWGQTIDSKVGVQTIYSPQFKVQDASDNNVQAWGIRWMLSGYKVAPLEFGFYARSGYGDVSHLSIGINLAYLLAKFQNHDFKVGLGLSNN